MELDLVSIITPSFDCEQFIEATVRSVQSQTYSNWEMIIVDDCSTDSTMQILTRLAKEDNRIHILSNPTNSGAAVSRNKALKEAKGRWIAFLDSDDLWLPEKLERQIAFMTAHNYAFSYTNYRAIDENGTEMGVEISGPKHVTRQSMMRYNWMGCLTVMYDASVVGLIQIPDLKKRNDYAIWLRAIKKTDSFLLEESLSLYRHRSNSISRQSFIRLIRYHYDLFHISEGYGVVLSLFFALRNLLYGFVKKVFYKKKYSI